METWHTETVGTKSLTLEQLFTCLASPDPKVRDGLAYETLTELMRSGKLTPEELHSLFAGSLDTITASDEIDPEGVFKPFAVLTLAEAIRADRLAPYLTPADRETALTVIANYLESLVDYRGFDPDTGWRHGVAHAADVLLQMVLNPAFGKEDHERILEIVAGKVAPATHAYSFGEPRRLARPVLYTALAGTVSEEVWDSWFTELAKPAPLDSWDEVWTDAEGLARLHNLRAFLTTLYVTADSSGAPELAIIRANSLAMLAKLP